MVATRPCDDVRESAFSNVWVGCADEIMTVESSPTLVELIKEVSWELMCLETAARQANQWSKKRAVQTGVVITFQQAEKEDEDRVRGVEADE